MSYRGDRGRGGNFPYSGPPRAEGPYRGDDLRDRGKYSGPPRGYPAYDYKQQDYFQGPGPQGPVFPVVGAPPTRPPYSGHGPNVPSRSSVRPPHPYGANFGDRSAATEHLGRPVYHNYDDRHPQPSGDSHAREDSDNSYSSSQSKSDNRKPPASAGDAQLKTERSYRRKSEKSFSHGSDADLSDSEGRFRDGKPSRSKNTDGKKSLRSDCDSGSDAGKPKKSTFSIDDLLQDERLKSVLFAGISKATAKLEQSLKRSEGETSELAAHSDSSRKQHTSHPLPNVSLTTDLPQKPKSILKRKIEAERVDKKSEEPNVDALNKLSALEKTLHLLRGKTSVVAAAGGSEKGGEKQSAARQGALGQLEKSYSDSDDDAEMSKKPQQAKKTVSDTQPFWSVGAIPAMSEKAEKEPESFDLKEKLYEQWRQSINRATDEQRAPINEQDMLLLDPFLKKKVRTNIPAEDDEALRSTDRRDDEELDSTVQNILQSIGFNFDLSKRMQELARQKKKQQDVLSTGIINQSATFLGSGDGLAHDVRAALFSAKQEEGDIESLIKEARASAQKNRSNYDKSESSNQKADVSYKEKIYGERGRSPEHVDRRRDETRQQKIPGLDSPDNHDVIASENSYKKKAWETLSLEKDEWAVTESQKTKDKMIRQSHERGSETRIMSFSRESDTATPPHGGYLKDDHWRSKQNISSQHGERSLWISERATGEPKTECFNPDGRGYTELSKALPHLAAHSSRRKEDLISDVLPTLKLQSKSGSTHVQNFRVTSSAVDCDNEPFTESRRVIIPSRPDQRMLSPPPVYRHSPAPNYKGSRSPMYKERQSPVYRGSRSPVYTSPHSPVYKSLRSPERAFRKRSASPLEPVISKDRKVYDERGGLGDHDAALGRRSLELRESPNSQSIDRHSVSYYKSTLLRSTQPVFTRLAEGGIRTPERIKSPIRDDYYSRSYIRTSPDRYKSRSPFQRNSRSLDRFRSPGRRISRSPGRRISRSPGRRISRSPGRRISRSPGRRISRSPGRRISRSPGRQISRSPGRQITRSPGRQISRSPGRQIMRSPGRQMRSPGRQISRSPGRRISRSPGRQIMRSPGRQISRSPGRRISRSPGRRISRSPGRRISRSPGRRISRSPSRRISRSPIRRISRSPVRQIPRSPGRRKSRSPGRRESKSPGKRRSRSPKTYRSRSRSFDRHKLSQYRHVAPLPMVKLSKQRSFNRLQPIAQRQNSNKDRNQKARVEIKAGTSKPKLNKDKPPEQTKVDVSKSGTSKPKLNNKDKPPEQTKVDVSKSGTSKSKLNNKDKPPEQTKVDVSKSGTSKSKLNNKDKPPEKTKVDVSKLPSQSRKEYLQKLLEEKASTANIKLMVEAAVEKLADFPLNERKEILIKMTQMTVTEKQLFVQKLALREARLSILKTELEKLAEDKNEIMRKCQRGVMDLNNPDLLENTRALEKFEKEMLILNTAEFDIYLTEQHATPPPSHPPKDVKMVSEKTTAVKKKPRTSSDTPKSTEKARLAAKQTDKEKKPLPSSDQEKITTVTALDRAGLSDGGVIKEKDKPDKETKQDAQVSSSCQLSSRQSVYYEYYDSGNHWCRHCSCSFGSLDLLFQHNHDRKHRWKIENEKKPWKDNKEKKPPTRRVGMSQARTIKGTEMMFPSVGFYCSLCQVFFGDFIDSADHLKSDSHYDKYMKYIKQNPLYEKTLLLEKTKALAIKKQSDKETPTPPPPPPPPPLPQEPKKNRHRTEKTNESDNSAKTRSVRNLRTTGGSVDSDSDNMDIVDMDIDNGDSVRSEEEEHMRVPKLTKPLTVLPAWTSLTAEGSSTEVEMKETKEDDNQPLDKFLTIEQDKSNTKQLHIPVRLSSKLDISDIPIPGDPCPLPVSAGSKCAVIYTVKSLKEVKEEEKKIIDDEKRMMGIDVDAEEEKPLLVTPVPPPSLANTSTSGTTPTKESEEESRKNRPASLDTLFTRLSRTVSHKSKPKATAASAGSVDQTVLEMEQKIKDEMMAKIARERANMIKKKQREELREKMSEEEATVKKKIDYYSSVSDSSSDNEYEDISDAESVTRYDTPEMIVNLPDGAGKLSNETMKAWGSGAILPGNKVDLYGYAMNPSVVATVHVPDDSFNLSNSTVNLSSGASSSQFEPADLKCANSSMSFVKIVDRHVTPSTNLIILTSGSEEQPLEIEQTEVEKNGSMDVVELKSVSEEQDACIYISTDEELMPEMESTIVQNSGGKLEQDTTSAMEQAEATEKSSSSASLPLITVNASGPPVPSKEGTNAVCSSTNEISISDNVDDMKEELIIPDNLSNGKDKINSSDVIEEEKCISNLMEEETSLADGVDSKEKKSITDVMEEEKCIADIVEEEKCIADVMEEEKCIADIMEEEKCIADVMEEEKCIADVMEEEKCIAASMEEEKCIAASMEEEKCIAASMEAVKPTDVVVEQNITGLRKKKRRFSAITEEEKKIADNSDDTREGKSGDSTGVKELSIKAGKIEGLQKDADNLVIVKPLPKKAATPKRGAAKKIPVEGRITRSRTRTNKADLLAMSDNDAGDAKMKHLPQDEDENMSRLKSECKNVGKSNPARPSVVKSLKNSDISASNIINIDTESDDESNPAQPTVVKPIENSDIIASATMNIDTQSDDKSNPAQPTVLKPLENSDIVSSDIINIDTESDGESNPAQPTVVKSLKNSDIIASANIKIDTESDGESNPAQPTVVKALENSDIIASATINIDTESDGESNRSQHSLIQSDRNRSCLTSNFEDTVKPNPAKPVFIKHQEDSVSSADDAFNIESSSETTDKSTPNEIVMLQPSDGNMLHLISECGDVFEPNPAQPAMVKHQDDSVNSSSAAFHTVTEIMEESNSSQLTKLSPEEDSDTDATITEETEDPQSLVMNEPSVDSGEATQSLVINQPSVDSGEATQSMVMNEPIVDSGEATQSMVTNQPSVDIGEATQSMVMNEPIVDSGEATQSMVTNQPSVDIGEATQSMVMNEPSVDSGEATQSMVMNEPIVDSGEVTQSMVTNQPSVDSGEATQSMVINQPSVDSGEATQSMVMNEPSVDIGEVTQSMVMNEPSVDIGEVTQSMVMNEPSVDIGEVTQSMVMNEPSVDIGEVTQSMVMNEPSVDIGEVTQSMVMNEPSVDIGEVTQSMVMNEPSVDIGEVTQSMVMNEPSVDIGEVTQSMVTNLDSGEATQSMVTNLDIGEATQSMVMNQPSIDSGEATKSMVMNQPSIDSGEATQSMVTNLDIGEATQSMVTNQPSIDSGEATQSMVTNQPSVDSGEAVDFENEGNKLFSAESDRRDEADHSLQQPVEQPNFPQFEDAKNNGIFSTDYKPPADQVQELGDEILQGKPPGNDSISPQHHSTGQSRDPPMSGVVGDADEATDSMMTSVTEIDSESMELEALPTAGLSLGLDEEESMEFAMVDLEDKVKSAAEEQGELTPQ